MLCQTPTHLDHRPSVKIDINKTYFSTGKTRYNGQIGTQQRLQINLFKTTTTKGHQILQSITEPKHSNHKSKKAMTNNFVFTFSFSWEQVQDLFFLDCRVSYSLTYNNNTDKHRTYQRLRRMLLTHVHRLNLITNSYLKHRFLSEQRPQRPTTVIAS